MSDQEQEAAINEAMHTGDWSGMAKNKSERRAMEKTEVMMCKECEPLPCPCVTTANVRTFPCHKDRKKWQPVTVTINPQPEPEPQDMPVFGDEIEVQVSDRFETAMFVNDFGDGYNAYFPKDNVIRTYGKKRNWRRPLRERIRVGQPVVVWAKKEGEDYSRVMFFSEFRDDGFIAVCNFVMDEEWSKWRLPTQAELDEIGHGSGGWLTSDGGE